MSFTLKSIELSNIRSHKHIVFEPLKKGVTAISGENGSGKSTLANSLSWILYGTKAPGVSKASSIIREGTDMAQEKVYARAVLEFEGKLLRVERRMVSKQGAVECDVWEGEEGKKEWTHLAGPAVSHAEPYLRKLLKMDEKGFLASVLVQQKQVDQLIAATPRERAEVIEKLTGISSITAALGEARTQYNSLKKVLSLTSLDESELARLKEEVLEDAGKLESQKTLLGDALGEVQAATAAVKKLREEVAAGEEAEAAEATLRTRLERGEALIPTLEESLARLTAMKEEKRKKLSQEGGTSNLQEVTKTLQKLREASREQERRRGALEARKSEAEARAAAHREVLEKSTVKTLEEAQAGAERYRKREESLEARAAALAEEAATHGSEAKKLASAAAVISKHEGSCPTCLQRVEEPEAAVGALQEQEAQALAKREEALQERAKTLEQLEKAVEGSRKFAQLLESLSQGEESAREVQRLEAELLEAEASVKAGEQELRAAEEVHSNCRRFEDLKQEYDALREEAVGASDKLETARRTLEEVKRALAESKPVGGRGGLPGLRRKLEGESEKREKLLEKQSALREEVSLLGATLEHKRELVAKGEEEVKRYHDLMKSVEVAGTTAETLEEFREDRVRNSLPIVAAYASDLLNRFTEGAFTHLKLDEKFNATVVLSSGVERPVGLLSGGELSAAAISLRLAISLLLTSGSASNMLILDEVLVSQDAARAELILATIKEVCQGQVVMISHGPHSNEIADRVVEL